MNVAVPRNELKPLGNSRFEIVTHGSETGTCTHRRTVNGIVFLLFVPDNMQMSTKWSSNYEIVTDDLAGWVSTEAVDTPRRSRDPVVPVVPLSKKKAMSVNAIDQKTDSLISAGFTVDGKTFSASDTAQLKWLGMYTSRADLSYPVTVPTKDDLSFVSLIEAADIATYYAALLARIQTVLAGGVTLKAQIAAATNQAELDAIVDNRT